MKLEKHIKDRIKLLRSQKGIKQSEFAEMVSLSQGAYSNLENGETELSISKLEKIAFALGVSVQYLLFGDEQSPQDTSEKDRKIRELEEDIEEWESFGDRVLVNLSIIADNLFEEFVLIPLIEISGKQIKSSDKNLYLSKIKGLISNCHNYFDVIYFTTKIFDIESKDLITEPNYLREKDDLHSDYDKSYQVSSLFIHFHRIAAPISSATNLPVYKKLFKLISVYFGNIK